ncbi:MAG: DUF389 domain-containing protein [Bacteroidales bacterium]|jgi:uncharacterized hydrophobic protein (TIGR00271 family)|nr:DUF389 domain-containing protein [Bacteroidales bacterium]
MKYNKPLRRLLKLINLESDLDEYENIHETIEKELVFKGTNLWILVFAILVASVGLNMNSTAVIIGAMLISPLMGPINGIGYSIATYDFPLFRQAVKNFTFAVLAGLIASTTYFAISPISTAHSELLARTSPTIYDVLIAFFGGMAGIVAITSKKKGNVIPGVAIATALMPPLCTAGYGLATGQFAFLFGALYLFTINSVFIALSALIISQILKLPIRGTIDEAQKKRINQMISAVLTLVLIPSIYFGYMLVQKENFTERASRYIENISVVEGNYLFKHDINPKTRTIQLVYGGTSLSELQKNEIVERANDFALKDVNIKFEQGFSYADIALRNSEVETLKAEINRLNMVIRERNAALLGISATQEKGGELLSELVVLYPQVTEVSYAQTLNFVKERNAPDTLALVIVTTNGKDLSGKDKEQVEKWLSARLKSDTVKVLFNK